MLDSVSLSRLKWRSRRGMLENDLVLTTFFERRGAEIDQVIAAGLSTLLELDDGDLWDLIARRAEPGPAIGATARLVLEELRGCRPAPQTA
jgi:antitoxin CptB